MNHFDGNAEQILMRGVHDQATLGFVVKQVAHIEAQVIEQVYPDITYAQDVPVDTSANPFAKSVTYYAMDKVGAAKLMSGRGDDVPLANVELNEFETQVQMAGIGYGFSLEEVGHAAMLGMGLDSMGANAANYAYERFVDNTVYTGNADAGFNGLYNYPGITTTAAGGVWAGLTAQQIIAELNAMLIAPYQESNGVELPNTVRMPLDVMADLSSRQLAPETDTTIMDFILRKNVWTVQTGQPLNVRGDYRLTDRVVAYHNSTNVLKMHMPMALRFLPVQPVNLEYKVPGMFRLGGLDIRRPTAVRYLDGVSA